MYDNYKKYNQQTSIKSLAKLPSPNSANFYGFRFGFNFFPYGKNSRISIRRVNSLYLKFGQCLVNECERQTPLYSIVELDESCFGAKRIRGKCGYGMGNKTIVLVP